MPLIQIKVIIPKRLMFDYNKWTREIKRVMKQRTEPELKALFRGTVEGWKKPPTFWASYIQTPSSIGVQVYAREKVYAIVTRGSPPHTIRARRRGLLRFQPGYRASTRPGSLQSGAAMRFGAVMTAVRVNHPGFAARNFDKQIADVYGPTFAADMEKTFA